jgi:putative transposase
MTLRGRTHAEIMKTLQVSSGFISKWKQVFILKGVAGIKLGYRGSLGYLTEIQKQQVIDWLKSQKYWNLNELECYIAEKFDVTFVAKSSYYDFFSEAGISWKKSQKKNPRKNQALIDEKKKEIKDGLENHREQIEEGKMVVLFLDECHLLWGDICGYIWGKTDIRIEVPIKNEKQRQTYYGALNAKTGQVILQAYPQGNTVNTIKFVEHLRSQYPQARLVLIWDGAAYHHSQEFRDYLEEVNQGKTEEEWLLKCIRLAANAPEQNPIEDVWLQAKELLRKCWHLCQNFHVVKWLFEWVIRQDVFCFPKLSMYS